MSHSDGVVADAFNSDLVPKRRTIPSGRPRLPVPSAQNECDTIEGDDAELEALFDELRTELDLRKKEEERLLKEIADILFINYSGGEHSRAFGKAVSKLNNQLVVAETDAKQLAASLATISRLADNISGKVSALDIAKNRVVECFQLAGDMRDLGVCSEGIDEAIKNDDFETAAQYIRRFLTLDQAVFQVKDSKDAGQSIVHSYEVLSTASVRLKGILEQRLESAVQNENIVEIQRFAKLFPLINQHETGLKHLSVYLNGRMQKLGDDILKVMNAGGSDDNRVHVLYADSVFLFLDGIATILDSNHPLIFGSYGADRVIDLLNMIQGSIDTVVDSIFTAFSKKRHLNTLTKTVQWQQRESKTSKTDRLNPLELDVLLNEICLIISHTEMYGRFVRQKLMENVQQEFESSDEDDSATIAAKKEHIRQKSEERCFKVDQLLNRSVVGTIVQKLAGSYVLLEHCYMEESFKKAIEMECREEDLRSSLVDDVLFLVKKCVRRAISSGSVDCVCSTLNNGCTLLETTFVKHLETAIKSGYPSGGFAAEALQTAQAAYNVIQHGKSGIESGTEIQRESFLTAANNACSASELISKLATALKAEWTKKNWTKKDLEKLEHSLSQLEDVRSILVNVTKHSMESLSSSAILPHLKTRCESYLDLPHEISETQFNEFEAIDPFIEQFNANLDKLLGAFDRVLLPDNYQELLLVVCGEVARQMERVIMKCSFNRLGALQLDREMRSLSTYLSRVAGWSARERIQRLAQIVSLLNVDSTEEARELWEAGRGSITRELTSNLVRKVLHLRSDIPPGTVDNLQL